MNNLLKNAYIFFLYSEILCEISDNKAKTVRYKKRAMTSFQDIMALYIERLPADTQWGTPLCNIRTRRTLSRRLPEKLTTIPQFLR